MSEVLEMQGNSTEAFDIVDRISQRLVDAIRRQDADALAQLYAEDAQHFSEHGTPKGREAIRAWHQEGFDSTGGTFSVSVTEAGLLGDTAYGVGTFASEGESGAIKGNWISVNKNEGGEWRIHRLIAVRQPPSS